MFQLVFGLILFAAIAGGGALVWHSIGQAAVEKHEAAVKAEEDKQAAIAKTRDEEAEKWLANAAAQHEVDEANQKEVERKVYIKGQDIVRYLPAAARSTDCTIPPDGMAVLNGARAQAAAVFGFGEAVTITDTDPRVPPEQATKPQPVAPSSGKPPKPIPVGPK